jgi:hypothetical protein
MVACQKRTREQRCWDFYVAACALAAFQSSSHFSGDKFAKGWGVLASIKATLAR